MPLRGDLLNPIPGADPAGADLRYDPVYDKIKEARQQDDDAPQGDWQRQRKVADFALVTKLAGDALAGRSKDLQLAAWLTEAQLHREGFTGLLAGLHVIRSLLVEFWDGLHPPIEDGDPELRAAPLGWIGYALAPIIRSVPLNRSGHDFFKYKESRVVGFEADASETKAGQARQQAIADGKLTGEEFDKGFESTPKNWYKSVVADIDGCVEAVSGLDAICKERFGDASPTFTRLQEALEEVRRVARQLLARKLELDPDPPEPEPITPPPVSGPGGFAPSQTERPMNASEAVDRDDATSRILAAARFLRRTEPRNPASYLLLRGFRWGEVRVNGGNPDPRLLEAPSTQVRTHLKGLLLEARWAQLLESAEGVMATAAGRGWLDLQRYVLAACRGLGGDYDAVARGIKSELKALLADMPQLTTMTLMDDMPTANHETLQWLRDGHFSNGADPASETEEAESSLSAAANGSGSGGADVALQSALVEARAGRPQRAIELLMGALAREKTARARFLRRTQVSRMMVDAGLEPIAVPILEELLELIERHNLADWESGDMVAEPMALLHRCMDKVAAEVVKGPHTQASLYPRICSLDPLQAMSLSKQ